jgi:hypothetical protein
MVISNQRLVAFFVADFLVAILLFLSASKIAAPKLGVSLFLYFSLISSRLL